MSSWRTTLRVFSLWTWFSVIGISALGAFKGPVDPWRILVFAAVFYASAELARLVDLGFRYYQTRLSATRHRAPPGNDGYQKSD
jgi:hypothetical protein